MKIGLLKFCIPLDFAVLTSTVNSGVDDRYGLIRELLRRGHEVTLFTSLVRGTRNNPKEERWLLETKEEDLPENIRFIKKLGYAPAGLPVGDLKQDVLLAESGVGNIVYSDKYNDNIDKSENTLIRRFMQVVNAHKGPVFYLHNDPSLPFYFRQLTSRKYPWGHKKNGYTNPIKENRNYAGWVKNSAWGTFDEIFKDKKNIILTRALPKHWEYMLDAFNVDRAGYKELAPNLHFEYQPPAYDYSICDGLKFQTEIKYPLFYSGSDRYRRIAFRRYYEEMGLPTFVSGNWKDEAKSGFDGIKFLGWLEDRKDLLDHMNVAGAVVQIQPKHASKMGWWTARPMEAPAAKTMAFIDGNISGAQDLVFDNWFVVKSKDEASKKIKSFLNLKNFERRNLIETQLAYCKTHFTWEKFVDIFLVYCTKYLDQHQIERKIRPEYESYTSLNLMLDSKKLSDIWKESGYDKSKFIFEEITVPSIEHNSHNGDVSGISIHKSKEANIQSLKVTFQDIPTDILSI